MSADSVEVQRKFVERFSLTFPMISDVLKEVISAWGAREILGIVAKRSTFLIGPDGKIAHVWPRVSVEGHADDVVATIRSIRQQS